MLKHLLIKWRASLLIHLIRWARWKQRQTGFGKTATSLERPASSRALAAPSKGLRIPILQFSAYPQLLSTYESSLIPGAA